MKRFQTAILAAAVLTLAGLSSAQLTLYVNPTTGNDSWAGTISSPSGGNGPLKTPAGVQAAIVNHGPCNGPIVVNFEAGAYYLTSAWTIPAADTCTSNASKTITYQAWSGNTSGTYPVISGGAQLNGLTWSHATNTNGTIWWVTLPAQFTTSSMGYTPEALYFNGQRRFRTRFGAANATYSSGAYNLSNLAPASFPGPAAPEPNGRIPSQSTTYYDRFTYASGDWPDTVATASNSNYNGWNPNAQSGSPCTATLEPTYGGDIEVLVFEKWTLSRERVSCIDKTNKVVYLLGSTAASSDHGYIPGHRYIVENFVTRDSSGHPVLYQGQFFIDRNTGSSPFTLYYEQISGEPAPNASGVSVVLPLAFTPSSTNCASTSCGAVLAATGIQNVTFSGLTFANDNFFPPTSGYGAIQSDTQLGMMVSCIDCSNVTWTGNIFTQTTGHGLELQTSSGSATPTANTINGNYFVDLGGVGIMYGHTPRASDTSTNILNGGEIENNLVQGYGRMYPGSSAIEHPMGAGTTISYNDVDDGYQTGIGVCIPNATANCYSGSKSAVADNISVDYNHVWNIGKGVTDDMGAIYIATYLASGNQVYDNKLHDINDAQVNDTDGYGGNGIYADQEAGYISIENNLVYRASWHAAQNTNGPTTSGYPNTWKNNIFAYGRVSMFYDGSPTQTGVPDYLVNSLMNNVFYFDGTQTARSSCPGSGTIEQNNAGCSFSFQSACTVGTGVTYANAAQQWNENIYYNPYASNWSSTSGAFYTVTVGAANCGPAYQTPLTWSTWTSTASGYPGQDTASSVITNTSTHVFTQPYCTLSTIAACENTSSQDNYSIASGYTFPANTFNTATFNALSAGRTSQTFPSCPNNSPYSCTVVDTFPTSTFSVTSTSIHTLTQY